MWPTNTSGVRATQNRFSVRCGRMVCLPASKRERLVSSVDHLKMFSGSDVRKVEMICLFVMAVIILLRIVARYETGRTSIGLQEVPGTPQLEVLKPARSD